MGLFGPSKKEQELLSEFVMLKKQIDTLNAEIVILKEKNNSLQLENEKLKKNYYFLLSTFCKKEEQPDSILSLNDNSDFVDPMLEQAIDTVIKTGYASTSLIQRKLKVGYARAGRIMDTMEQMGIVGPHEGSKSRRVLLNSQQNIERKLNILLQK